MQEVTLRRGDVMKLGRAILRVSDIKFNGSLESNNEYHGPYQDSRIDVKNSKFTPKYITSANH